jgi:hypothetical protein
MTKIYDQHAAAFSPVSAFVVMKDGERVATIAFKFPKDGAGRLWCYVHWLGLEMQRGYAGGYGYDKRSAAVCDAVGKITMQPIDASFAGKPWYELDREMKAKESAAFKDVFKGIGGQDWDAALRAAGYLVLQAV